MNNSTVSVAGRGADSKPRRVQKFHLTEKLVRAFELPDEGTRIYYDQIMPGFGFKISAHGTRSWVLNYVAATGRERRLTIGRWPVWTASAARAEAIQIRRRVDRGEDPLEARKERRRADTFGELAAEYLERHAAGKRSGARDTSYLENDVLPTWKHWKVTDVSRADVIRLIEAKAQTAPTAANRLLAVIRGLFNWAIQVDLAVANPAAKVKPPTREAAKDRVLSADELRRFWRELAPGEAHVSADMVDALRLVLATAQRPGEVAGMTWAEIDLRAGIWTIPAERAKNGLAHRVPLNLAAREILEARRKAAGRKRKRGCVFPTPRGGGDQSIEVNALAHAVRRWLSSLPRRRRFERPWTPHDLRRTAASCMASAGVPRLVVGMVLNHSQQGITKVYDRHGYDSEKVAAMDDWNKVLFEAIGRDSAEAEG